MTSRVQAFGIGLAALTALSCGDLDVERMIHQHRYNPYEAAPYFADGRVMRPPPHATIPRGRALGDDARLEGMLDGQYVARIPIVVTRDTLEGGRRDFETFCAACHGIAGDGISVVAANMALRKPPTLVGPAARGFSPGRIYRVITEGYGLMRSYGNELDTDRRWGVVAYVRALQLSRGVPLASLPDRFRRRAQEALE